ncbi:hypothetical protein [Streptomyces sp. NBC_01707]|uniref:hypothetical protein n=1 Tax=Streptomyces sp. NBC_01707 TaxID=2975914 RepID=UPI00352D3883
MLAADGAVLPGGGRLPQPVDGRIRLRGVSYGTLEDLDLDIAPGDIVGVATPDPADATALLRCLPAGRADPDRGTVDLYGIPLTTLDPAEIRTAILVRRTRRRRLRGHPRRQRLRRSAPRGRHRTGAHRVGRGRGRPHTAPGRLAASPDGAYLYVGTISGGVHRLKLRR